VPPILRSSVVVLGLLLGLPASADVVLVPLSGGGALLVWSDATDVRAQAVDERGQLGGAPAIVLPCRPAGDRVAAVPTPSGAAVIFGRRGKTWLRRLGPDGQPVTDASRIFEAQPRPPTAVPVGGEIGMLGRREAGPVVGSPAHSAIATLVGTSDDEGPQLLVVRWEGVPVLGPALPWHVGYGEAVLGAREAEVASLAASTDGVFLTRIGLDARAIGNPLRLSADDGSGGSRPSIVGTTDGYIALWHSGGAVHVVIARAGEDGLIVTPRAPGRGEPVLTDATLATSGSRHALVGRAGDDLVALRFGDNGRTVGRPTIALGAFAGLWAPRVSAAFVGRRLLVAIPGETPRVVVAQ
jgi:hypothetical protein